MAEALDYAKPDRRPSVFRSIVIGLFVLTVALLLGENTLDEGQLASITKRLAGGYLVGVVLILGRRRRSPTVADHWFIRAGLVPILIVGTPIAVALWEHWHLIWS